MTSYILLAVCAVTMALEAFRAWRRPPRSWNGLVGPVVTVAVTLLFSRAIAWHEAVPLWVWPVASVLAAAIVGYAVVQRVTTPVNPSEAAARTAPR